MFEGKEMASLVFETEDEAMEASKMLDYVEIFNEMVGDDTTINVYKKDIPAILVIFEDCCEYTFSLVDD